MDAISAMPRPSNSTGGRFRRRSSSEIEIKRQQKKRKVSDDDINTYLVKKAIRVANKNGEFVWRKKIDRDVARDGLLDELIASKAEKKTKQQAEIEKLKKRKEQRAIQKAQREEEIAVLARERTRADAVEFEKKEDEFELSQSKIRSHIRLREQRAKPVDLLTAYIEDWDWVQLDEPCAVFKKLSFSEMENLREEIKMRVDSDRDSPIHTEYWEALLVVCDWELAEATRRKVTSHELGIHPSTESDVRNVLEGKTHEDLLALQSQIEYEMRSGRAMEVEFWEAVLSRIGVYMAKARLNEFRVRLIPKLEEPVENSIYETEEEEVVDPIDEDAYRLRKPKYVNRVYTGYEWNKYNRAHYDHENPPPKFVQGYRFEVFYPDLVDKSKAPEYFIEKDGGVAETCIIRFHAGPPYEDIAFRVVNGDWNKEGYKCTFNGEILRLHFNLKRLRYKR